MTEQKENGNCWKFLPPKRGKFIFANFRPKDITLERNFRPKNMARKHAKYPPPWVKSPLKVNRPLEFIEAP